jgi:hypothetical protein
VEVLKGHPKKYARFLVLADKVPSGFPTLEPTEMVFVLLRGEENQTEKVRSLNGMSIDWVSEKKLKKPLREGGSYYPAPASLNTMVRTFFASAKDYYQGSFSQKDFSFNGGYNGFFAALCKKRREEDVSFLFCFFRQFLKNFFSLNQFKQHFTTARIWKQIQKHPSDCRRCRQDRPFKI